MTSWSELLPAVAALAAGLVPSLAVAARPLAQDPAPAADPELQALLDRIDRFRGTSTAARDTLRIEGTYEVVFGGAAGLYLQLFTVQQARATAVRQQLGQGMPDPKQMVARLEARLRDNPNDLEGQIMAGRSYMALERSGDALRAWTKVIELDPKNPEAHFNIGVILLTTRKTDDPKLFEEAMAHLDIAYVKLPQEPALLWYRGIVFVHQKRYSDADAAWTAAYQNLQPGSEDSKFVRQALGQLRSGKPPLF